MNLLQIHEPSETPLPHEHTVAVGIDLGTTHSVVAIARDGKAAAIPDASGSAIIPSVVWYGQGVSVGETAKRAGGIASIKRRMHHGAEKIRQGGIEVTPVEVSAEILKHLKNMAEQALDQEVTKAVITVPAYFDDAARTATKDAARLAGLEVLRLINEPTAAALAYGLDHAAEGVYAIYDLGGGTFDVSVLRLQKGVFQVLATGGDTQLGGDDIDQALAADVMSKLGEETPKKSDIAALIAEARVAKERLSDAEETTLHGVTITRRQLELIVEPYLERTLAICEGALRDADIAKEYIDGVVLVGGSTRMPLLRQKVSQWFGREALVNVDPDLVVAYGAALQAEGLTQGSDNLLLDVVPLSLGLETIGGLTEKLIHRNTPIPVSVAQEFTTWQDGQTGMQIQVLQGEREMMAHNRSLARFELKGIPPLPAGLARVKVTFAVDADGLLTVAAEELTTGKQQEIAVKPSYGIEPEEIERMLRISMEHAREDITERLTAEAKIEAERAIIELESAMKQDGALLTEPERKLIAAQIGYLREAIAEGDRDRIDVELQQLGQAAHGFAERRMDNAVAGALKGKLIDTISE